MEGSTLKNVEVYMWENENWVMSYIYLATCKFDQPKPCVCFFLNNFIVYIHTHIYTQLCAHNPNEFLEHFITQRISSCPFAIIP